MRKTKVVGFSIPPELKQKFENLAKKKHKTKSEFFREILNAYFQSLNQVSSSQSDLNINETNLANILKSYWQLQASLEPKTIVIGLGIIVQNGKVLIGARKKEDQWVEKLSWVFPGGKMDALDFKKEIKKEIKQETNLNVQVENLVGARIHPDSGFKSVQIVALYFHCTVKEKQNENPGGDLEKLKWVNPTDVFKYFTTSTSDEVTKFLITLEKSA